MIESNLIIVFFFLGIKEGSNKWELKFKIYIIGGLSRSLRRANKRGPIDQLFFKNKILLIMIKIYLSYLFLK